MMQDGQPSELQQTPLFSVSTLLVSWNQRESVVRNPILEYPRHIRESTDDLVKFPLGYPIRVCSVTEGCVWLQSRLKAPSGDEVDQHPDCSKFRKIPLGNDVCG